MDNFMKRFLEKNAPVIGDMQQSPYGAIQAEMVREDARKDGKALYELQSIDVDKFKRKNEQGGFDSVSFNDLKIGDTAKAFVGLMRKDGTIQTGFVPIDNIKKLDFDKDTGFCTIENDKLSFLRDESPQADRMAAHEMITNPEYNVSIDTLHDLLDGIHYADIAEVVLDIVRNQEIQIDSLAEQFVQAADNNEFGLDFEPLEEGFREGGNFFLANDDFEEHDGPELDDFTS